MGTWRIKSRTKIWIGITPSISSSTRWTAQEMNPTFHLVAALKESENLSSLNSNQLAVRKPDRPPGCCSYRLTFLCAVCGTGRLVGSSVPPYAESSCLGEKGSETLQSRGRPGSIEFSSSSLMVETLRHVDTLSQAQF